MKTTNALALVGILLSIVMVGVLMNVEKVAAQNNDDVFVGTADRALPERYQISAYAGPGNGGNIHHGCYVVDITTGAVWHMALGQKPEQVAEKLP